ncbi:hypothetical protein NL676_039789 [Syzygium grande]|nr:hypothetical protein NL676_039789 [Syzygium grande]
MLLAILYREREPESEIEERSVLPHQSNYLFPSHPYNLRPASPTPHYTASIFPRVRGENLRAEGPHPPEGDAKVPSTSLRPAANRYGIDGGEQRSLSDIGNIFGLSKERARQLERRALYKLKQCLGSHGLHAYGQLIT